MFRRWLISLLNRPRVPEAVETDVDSNKSRRDVISESAGFQPIRSQEEIQNEEHAVSHRKPSMMAMLFDERGGRGSTRSRPSPQGDEAP